MARARRSSLRDSAGRWSSSPGEAAAGGRPGRRPTLSAGRSSGEEVGVGRRGLGVARAERRRKGTRAGATRVPGSVREAAEQTRGRIRLGRVVLGPGRSPGDPATSARTSCKGDQQSLEESCRQLRHRDHKVGPHKARARAGVANSSPHAMSVRRRGILRTSRQAPSATLACLARPCELDCRSCESAATRSRGKPALERERRCDGQLAKVKGERRPESSGSAMPRD